MTELLLASLLYRESYADRDMAPETAVVEVSNVLLGYSSFDPSLSNFLIDHHCVDKGVPVTDWGVDV